MLFELELVLARARVSVRLAAGDRETKRERDEKDCVEF